jgi:hypothetical protein
MWQSETIESWAQEQRVSASPTLSMPSLLSPVYTIITLQQDSLSFSFVIPKKGFRREEK